MQIKALANKVIVSEVDGGERIVNGIIVPDDNGKSEGVRPRWVKVHSVGENIVDIKAGQWVLMEHGRWTRPMRVKNDSGVEETFWGIDWPNGAMLVADEKPSVDTFSEHTSSLQLTR